MVWGEHNLTPTVWRLPFPPEITTALVSTDNLAGTITNLDLEMVGLLCHWLVLEELADLQHAHIAARCNNLPTVAWASWLLSSQAKTAAHLLHILTLWMLIQ